MHLGSGRIYDKVVIVPVRGYREILRKRKYDSDSTRIIIRIVSEVCSGLKNCYSFLITRMSPASPIAPIAAKGSMPAFVVGICVGEVVETVGGNGVSASPGRVVVAVRMFTLAALIGGTILTTYTEIA